MDLIKEQWEEIFGDDFPKQPDTKVENGNSYKYNQTPWSDYEWKTNKGFI